MALGVGGDMWSPSPQNLYVSFSFKGQKLTVPPREIFMTLNQNLWRQVVSAYPKPPHVTQLIVLADNDRALYTAVADREVRSKPFSSDYYWADDFSSLLPYKDFLRIVNSNQVEMKAAYCEVKLEGKHLEALRDFASRTDPNAKDEPLPAASPEAKDRLDDEIRQGEKAANDISSQLDSLAQQSQQPQGAAQKKSSPLAGTWMLRGTNPNNQTYSFIFKVEESGGGRKCYLIDSGMQVQLTDCTITEESYSFMLRNIPMEGQMLDATFSGELEGDSLKGSAIINSRSGLSITLPMTGTRVRP